MRGRQRDRGGGKRKAPAERAGAAGSPRLLWCGQSRLKAQCRRRGSFGDRLVDVASTGPSRPARAAGCGWRRAPCRPPCRAPAWRRPPRSGRCGRAPAARAARWRSARLCVARACMRLTSSRALPRMPSASAVAWASVCSAAALAASASSRSRSASASAAAMVGRALVEQGGEAGPQDLAQQDHEQHEGDRDPGLRIAQEAGVVTLNGGLRGLVGSPGATHQRPPFAAATLARSALPSAGWPETLL